MPDDSGTSEAFLAALAAIDESFPPTMMTVRDDSVRLFRLETKTKYLGEYIAYLEGRIAKLEGGAP
ncbi:hypothetical protein BH09ACT4_BH09ACT4_19910 [soil metagenome]